jgi:hypothetical protein
MKLLMTNGNTLFCILQKELREEMLHIFQRPVTARHFSVALASLAPQKFVRPPCWCNPVRITTFHSCLTTFLFSDTSRVRRCVLKASQSNEKIVKPVF